jgi:hypothetical protein
LSAKIKFFDQAFALSLVYIDSHEMPAVDTEYNIYRAKFNLYAEPQWEMMGNVADYIAAYG